MWIDIPVVIAFDSEQNGRPLNHTRTFALRIDIDDDDAPCQFAYTYPGKEWHTDKDGAIVGLLPHGAYEKIVKAARANPYDYCSDDAEGERLQALIDAEREPVE